MMKPFITTEVATEIANTTFNKAMNEWRNFVASQRNGNVARYNSLTPSIITWKKMGFRAAGKTLIYTTGRIEIVMNINYLYSKDAKKFISNTLRHELAHALSWKYNQTCGHDKTWKNIARVIGDDAERCHDYAAPMNKPVKNTVRKVRERKKFVCPKCGTVHNLTPLMQKRCAAGGYACKCGMPTYKFVTC